jgi:Sec-independent protein translocase protein TatA
MDLWIVLVIILVAVIVWRGPKTLPQLGRAFGRGVKEAREEAVKAQAEIQTRTTTDPEDRVGSPAVATSPVASPAIPAAAPTTQPPSSTTPPGGTPAAPTATSTPPDPDPPTGV